MAVVAYKCPSCGAGIAFDSGKQLFRCEYCLSEYTEEQIAAGTPTEDTSEEQQTTEAENGAFCEELLSYSCTNCGAEVFADKDTVADHCYYCHNPIVSSGRLTGQLRPHKIVPFAYDKAAAEKKFLEFARKKWFVPKDFFAEKQVEKIQGIYYPFWLTDLDISASSSAKAEKVRTWKLGKNLYTETSHYHLYRKGNIHFEDVTTGAYDNADKAMLEGILPYPSDALKDFSMPYLSGFLAKKRNVEKETVFDEVKNRVNNYSATLLGDTMRGYTAVHPVGTQVQMHKVLWDYALLPMWILTYNKGGKIYTYAMNGYTGKVYGELPISGKKLWILFFAVALGITLLGTIGGLFL
ncbi:MAG: TFIIB-type zinc ribbon-containing protein [Clostridia bacterium]|nr:TFIIB-type zinc ribbon-containing protein [Clostridia bacterium]